MINRTLQGTADEVVATAKHLRELLKSFDKLDKVNAQVEGSDAIVNWNLDSELEDALKGFTSGLNWEEEQ